MAEAFICDAIRTPIGRYGGALSSVRTDDLARDADQGADRRVMPQVDWEALDDVLYGCANQAGEDNRNVARMAVLLAGLPDSVPGATINRLCGSGLDAVAIGRARDPHRRSVAGDRGRRRKHDAARRSCVGKADTRILARRADVRHHDRLALRQSAA